MHLFGHINCYPYPIYVHCYPVYPCCHPYYHPQEEVIKQQAPIYNGHEHGKG